MTLKEFEELKEYKPKPEVILNAYHLSHQEDRTLLFGYTSGRNTWHVYIKDCTIHTISYNYDLSEVTKIGIKKNSDYIPDKRLYPLCCDFEFCKKLLDMGIHLPFLALEGSVLRERSYTYYGHTL